MEGIRRQLRRRRSEVLKLMQQLGIDTTNWNRVDAFCEDVRIAGKAFRHISIDELEVLAVKLRAIKRKKEASPGSSEARGIKRGAVIMLPANQSIEN